MDWIFDNLQVIIVVAGTIAYWINQRRREKAGEEADYDGDGVPETPPVRRRLDPNEPDPEEAERTRRIQEEIRRKIAQRQGENPASDSAPPPLPAPTPVDSRPFTSGPSEAPRPVATPLPEVLRRVLEQVRDPELEARQAAEQAAARERQRQLQEQLDALEVARAQAQARAAALAVERSAWDGPRARSNERSWATELRSSKNLRRAMVLREVLGPPAGLK